MIASRGAWRQLTLIALVQMMALSLWFSASAVVPSLVAEWRISTTSATWLTTAVQLGFIVGALLSAVVNLADRVRPQYLIGVCAIAGAAVNAAFALLAEGLALGLTLRFLTGMALAGIYPVGLKLMASWFERGRGVALGALVGALTLGSGLPHLVNGSTTLPWPGVLLASSVLAVGAALLALAALRPGPYAAPTAPLAPSYVVSMFRERRQRLANLGYFGHMWELYALWTWLPAYVAASYAAWSEGTDTRIAVGLTAFIAIAVAGGIGCLGGGWLADRYGRAELTAGAMAVSGSCCVLAAATFGLHPAILVPFLLLWGAAVIADSAQFSTALTELADHRYVGTALTAQTALGFGVTVVTIQAIPALVDHFGWQGAMPFLALGPVGGVLAMMALRGAWEGDRRAAQ